MNKKRLLELAGVQLNEDWTDPEIALQEAVDAAARWVISMLVEHYEELRDIGQLEMDLNAFLDKFTDDEVISDRLELLDRRVARRVRELAPQAVKELRRGRIAQKRQRRE